MEHSETLAKLGTALAAAQAEIENATKNAKNPHFKSNYADLAEIINTTKPVLTKHGLAVVQVPGFYDGVVTVETMLLHTSGEWIRGVSGAPAQKQDPQGVGSAVTYLRRYSLAAVCCIAQEDDDSNSASEGPEKLPAQRSTPKADPADAPALKPQTDRITALLAERNVDADTRSKTIMALANGLMWKKANAIIEHLEKFPVAEKASAA